MDKREKEIYVFAIFKDNVTYKYKAVSFAGRLPNGKFIKNCWCVLPASKKFTFNFHSLRLAKKFIRDVFRDEYSPEYACIQINGVQKGLWWTHTKKHVEMIDENILRERLFTNAGTSLEELFEKVWSD